MEWIHCFPLEIQKELRQVDLNKAFELRLKPFCPVRVRGENYAFKGVHTMDEQAFYTLLHALSNHTFKTQTESKNSAFLPLKGGHRLGICGGYVGGEQVAVWSMCLRFAREIKSAGAQVMPQIFEHNTLCGTLIMGAPLSGKTTLLRDLIRRLSNAGVQVAVADERGEISGQSRGEKGLDVGENTDVLTGLKKDKALLYLVRSMAPQVIATDEVGGQREINALLRCAALGVPLIFSTHGTNKTHLRQRGFMPFIKNESVQKIVLLNDRQQSTVINAKDFVT